MSRVVLTTVAVPRRREVVANVVNTGYQAAVISDAFTARVIGCMVVIFVLIIDVSTAMFSRPQGSPLFPFAFYVSLPSVPFIIAGLVLIARAKRFDRGGDES
jgi:hypothetical protein